MNNRKHISVYGSVSSLTQLIKDNNLESDLSVKTPIQILMEGDHSMSLLQDTSSKELGKDVSFLAFANPADDKEVEIVLETLGLDRAFINILDDDGEDEDSGGSELLGEDELFDSLSYEIYRERHASDLARLKDTQVRCEELLRLREAPGPRILRLGSLVVNRMIPEWAAAARFVYQPVTVHDDGGVRSVEYDTSIAPHSVFEAYKFDMESVESGDKKIVVHKGGDLVLVTDPAALWVIESFTPAIITMITLDSAAGKHHIRSWFMHYDGGDGVTPDVTEGILEGLPSDFQNIPLSFGWSSDLSTEHIDLVPRAFSDDVAVVIADTLSHRLSDDSDSDDE